MSLEDLSGKSGVSRAMLSQIETLKTNPTIAVLWKIASGLGMSFAELLGNGNPSMAQISRKKDARYLYSEDRQFRSRPILTNVPGLLASVPDEASLVGHVPVTRLDWAEQVAQGHMKKKVLAAREALASGLQQVILADSRQPQPVQTALAGGGTWIGGG